MNAELICNIYLFANLKPFYVTISHAFKIDMCLIIFMSTDRHIKGIDFFQYSESKVPKDTFIEMNLVRCSWNVCSDALN